MVRVSIYSGGGMYAEVILYGCKVGRILLVGTLCLIVPGLSNEIVIRICLPVIPMGITFG